MVFFLIVVAAFALGFLLRGNISFVNSIGFPIADGTVVTSETGTKTTYTSLSPRIDEAENLLDTYSFDSLDLDETTDVLLEAMVEETGDPYAAYLNQERYEAYISESANSEYSGIGVLFGDYKGRAYATDVFSDCEAAALGVRQGDYVVSINGDSTHDWSMAEVLAAISDASGSSVAITWMHVVNLDATTGDEFTTTLACHEYTQENVTSSIEDSVGYIKVRQITSNSSDLVRDATASIIDSGATSLVLDLRDNPGGYLTQALSIASLFVDSGVLASIETKDETSSRTATGTVISDLPMVVLVNEYTGASAEVLSAALYENQRATTVGRTTMGKGSVQVVSELSFGGAIRYTAAYYLTPLGHAIDGAGIVPEVQVSQTDETTDTQLLVAIDTAKSLVG